MQKSFFGLHIFIYSISTENLRHDFSPMLPFASHPGMLSNILAIVDPGKIIHLIII